MEVFDFQLAGTQTMVAACSIEAETKEAAEAELQRRLKNGAIDWEQASSSVEQVETSLIDED